LAVTNVLILEIALLDHHTSSHIQPCLMSILHNIRHLIIK
jgi:hypothetical protein